jgi:hypothetical protein
MGPLEWVSSACLPNEETSPFQGLNFAILLDIYHEMVKDLGLKSRSHIVRSMKEVSSSDGQVHIDTISLSQPSYKLMSQEASGANLGHTDYQSKA